MTASPDDGAAEFESQRKPLFGLAYRMLGSVAEAEDVLQDAWLRWRAADKSAVRDPAPYLARIVARLSLDVLRSARVRRETYLGVWLPEPIVDDAAAAPDASVELASDLSVALILSLERLSPLERAAFLLHDVFDMAFLDVAGTLGRTEEACRQLAARGRRRIAEDRPRRAASPDDGAELADAFLKASREGDVAGLIALLSPEAVLLADGGGKRPAALKPVIGAEQIARFFARMATTPGGVRPLAVERRAINGLPGYVSIERDGLPQTTAFEIVDGRIAAIYVVRNPDKLGRLAGP